MGGRPGRCKTFLPTCPNLGVCQQGKCWASERSLQWVLPLQTMQVILSNAILRPDQQLCSLHKGNYLWTRLTTNYQICRKWLLRSKNNLGWSLPLVSSTTQVPASTATWWTATGASICHSSILKSRFLPKCLFTIYSAVWPINGRQDSLRFDPHRRKPCPWWHFITNSSFDDLRFIEKVDF